MSWFSDLFSSEQETESSTSQTRDPWSGASGPLQNFVNYAGEQGMNPMTFFGDQTYLNQTPEQMNALQGQFDTAGGYQQNVLDPAMGAWQQQLAGPDSGKWDTALSTYADDVNENLNRTVLPGINDQMTATGNRRSSLGALERGQARGDAANAIARQGANLALDFQNVGNQQQQFAMGNTGNMMNWGMTPGNLQYQTSQAMQQDPQNALSEEMARHEYGQTTGTWGSLNQAYPFVFNPAQAFGSSEGQSNSVTNSMQSPFNTIAGMAMTGMGMGMGGGGMGMGMPAMNSMGGGGNIGMTPGGGGGYMFGQQY